MKIGQDLQAAVGWVTGVENHPSAKIGTGFFIESSQRRERVCRMDQADLPDQISDRLIALHPARHDAVSGRVGHRLV